MFEDLIFEKDKYDVYKILPLVIHVYPRLLAKDIVGIQPIDGGGENGKKPDTGGGGLKELDSRFAKSINDNFWDIVLEEAREIQKIKEAFEIEEPRREV